MALKYLYSFFGGTCSVTPCAFLELYFPSFLAFPLELPAKLCSFFKCSWDSETLFLLSLSSLLEVLQFLYTLVTSSIWSPFFRWSDCLLALVLNYFSLCLCHKCLSDCWNLLYPRGTHRVANLLFK